MSRTLFVAACLSGLPFASRLSLGQEKRPNVLVIMSDEHNASVLGCYGNRIVKTPNLDRLARSGIVFDACYTNSPLCVPSRQSFTSGKYASRVSAWSNDSRMPDETPSIARVMAAAGYESFLCGKMHYDGTCRYGFTEIGGNMNPHHLRGTGERRPADDLSVHAGAGAKRFEAFHTGNESATLKHDRRVTAATLEFLRSREKESKPFFLVAGFIAPHFPLVVPEEYWKMYEGRVPMPDIPAGFLDSLPLNYKHLRAGFEMTDVSPETVRKGRELYYGLTTWLDEQLGTVFETLRSTGLAENTVVVYTTDHGENLGDHGLWWKNCMYESASHIPLIISWPGRLEGGQHRAGACSLVDVVQTIAEMSGATTPADWNGTSMVRWMRDADSPWKDMAVSEYYAHLIASGFVMIRQHQWKYVYHTRPDEKHPPERELYDLATDPGEFHNLAKDPAQTARIDLMHSALVKELGVDPELTEKRCREEISKGYGLPLPGNRKPNNSANEN